MNKIKFTKTYHESTGMVELREILGNTTKAVVLGMSWEDLQAWNAVESDIPEGFGPIYYNQFVSWAEQLGFIVIQPNPSWLHTIGSNEIALLGTPNVINCTAKE